MDVELLSRMVGELILSSDSVALPGLGSFVAEEVPASFSDRGYTINPPYRRLVFRTGLPEDDMLASFYASSNGVDLQAAKAIITPCLNELRSTLVARKAVALPGLGRLRATKENAFFFVADEDLDIFPEGCGLEPVSLKSREGHMPAALVDFARSLSAPPTAAPASADPSPASADPSPVPAPDEAMPAPAAAPMGSLPVSSPAPAAREEPAPEAPAAREESAPDEPAAREESAPEAPSAAQEPASEAPAAQEEPIPEAAAAPTPAPSPMAPAPAAPHRSAWRKPLVAFACCCAAVVVFLGAFALLGRVAPDLVDKILYSPEELEILHTQIDTIF